jgi:hypothetical protein
MRCYNALSQKSHQRLVSFRNTCGSFARETLKAQRREFELAPFGS